MSEQPGAGQPCPAVTRRGPMRSQEPIWDPLPTTLLVDGMVCRQCQHRIYNALADLPGVAGVHVSLERGTVEVLYDASRLSPDRIADVIRASAEGSPRTYVVREAAVPD